MTLKWGRWLTTWATFRKRLPSLTWAATILLAMATDANVIAVVPERYHFVLRYVVAVATVALLYTRSVATGSHGADYGVIVEERRGTGSRTGEMPATPPGEPRGLVSFGPPVHSTADAGVRDDAGEAL